MERVHAESFAEERGEPVEEAIAVGMFDEREHPVRTSERLERCEFRDMPPTGVAFSRTTELHVDIDPVARAAEVTISGGPMLIEDAGDFVLSIEVPDGFALERQITKEPGRILDPKTWQPVGDAEPASWPFREFWLTPEEASRYRDTLKVYDSQDGEEVRPDLVGR